MEYYDEEILEARREEERRKHNTLETGIYVDDILITFSCITIPESKIQITLPEQFIVMPNMVKDVKYPSKNAPQFIVTSLDSMVNFGFNILPVCIKEGDTQIMSRQFQNAIHNVNPSIRFENIVNNVTTNTGFEMSGFDFKGYTLDGQNYNSMYVFRMNKSVLHGIFNCPVRVMEQWREITKQCFLTVKEEYIKTL